MSLRTTYSPTVPVGGATSYKLRPVLTYSNGYWEAYRRFQGDFLVAGGGLLREGGYVGRTFHGVIFMGEKNFHEGSAGFSSIILKKTMKKE